MTEHEGIDGPVLGSDAEADAYVSTEADGGYGDYEDPAALAGIPEVREAPAVPQVIVDGPPTLDTLRKMVARVWGFDELRPFQAEAMTAALEDRDALVVLATGGGKSLCYQAPALVREGLTVVVSPLISLMKDQIDGLVANGVPAAMLSSAQDGYEKNRVRELLAQGALKLLFCAPERLLMPGFFEELEDYGLSAIVIDEAHCISHWGHDFRPEYRQIGELRRGRVDLPCQAFTATATPEVQADIVAQLGLQEPAQLVGSFDRPNLTYRFLPRSDLLSQTLAVVRRHPGGAGIVYCLRRKDVDKLATELAAEGVPCVPYHAGLGADVRRQNQELFLSERVQVVVATVAFGMGIDRPDVRFVVHASLPKGLEQFSQETGRAGRDGLASECAMFYSASDYYGWKSLMERSAAEAVAEGPDGRGGDPGGDLEQSIARLGRMLSFATGAVCRHRFLVEHFGQEFEGTGSKGEDGGCGACDVCLGELPSVADSQTLAQKILSCVVRCDQRYGAGHVADVLRGASTERLRQVGHDKLTTYGLLKEHTAREIRHWIEQLVGLDHLGVAPGPYPTLHLTQSGVAVMKGDAEITLFSLPHKTGSGRSKSKKSLAQVAAEEGAPPPDEALFEKLRGLRRKLASERGVPPYVIFNDRTLSLMASFKPANETELLAVKGVGEKKAADLGATFLEAIAAHVA